MSKLLVAVSEISLEKDAAAYSKHRPHMCVSPSVLPSFCFSFLQVISCADIHFPTPFNTLLARHTQFPTSGSFATYLCKVGNALRLCVCFNQYQVLHVEKQRKGAVDG